MKLWKVLLSTYFSGILVALFASQILYAKTQTHDDTSSSLQSKHFKNWLQVPIGVIGVSSESILTSAFNKVHTDPYDGLIIALDTPGGALENTRKMVKMILNAPFPIIVWVGPDGAHAGSAGAFITLSGHIATMAKSTNIGAAHPVQADGKTPDKEELNRKITNDAVSFIESIANKRGRNQEMARSFVRMSTSITADEAVENRVIDFLSHSPTDALLKAHGATVDLNGIPITMNTQDAKVTTYELSIVEQLLEILSNPNFFYLLFMAGLLGIGFEITHPGSILPGVVGTISLILALIATSVLPISFGAGALIIAGIIMLIAEVFIPSFGALGFGGFIAFVVGSIFLVDPSDEQGLRVSLFMIFPTAAIVAVGGLSIGWLILKSDQSKITSGPEAMLGKQVEIASLEKSTLRVMFEGEIWTAKISSTEPEESDLKPNDKVYIQKVDGLTLIVSKNKQKFS